MSSLMRTLNTIFIPMPRTYCQFPGNPWLAYYYLYGMSWPRGWLLNRTYCCYLYTAGPGPTVFSHVRTYGLIPCHDLGVTLFPVLPGLASCADQDIRLLSQPFIHIVLYEICLMTTVALLRKQTTRGTSTWRFCQDPTGSCFAITPRSERRWFADRRQMDRAISNWRGYGYCNFDHTEPVKRGAKQMICQLASA